MTLIISLPKTDYREIKPTRWQRLNRRVREATREATSLISLAKPWLRYTTAALCAHTGAALGNLIAPEMQFQGV